MWQQMNEKYTNKEIIVNYMQFMDSENSYINKNTDSN